jgi:phosphoribosylanthranilate isomerase
VLVNSKTLRGETNKWPNRYPKIEEMADIFPDDPRAFNIIHFNCDNKDRFIEEAARATHLAGPRIHGIQFNAMWPDASELNRYTRQFPFMSTILQIGPRAFGAVQHSAKFLARKVAVEYQEAIDHILLDASGGYGKMLQIKRFREYLLALIREKLLMGVGIAGGLSPETLESIRELAKEHPHISIDAESRLRTLCDHLDIEVATEYTTKAFSIFNPLL